MLPPTSETLDKRIVESWRAGLRSPAAIGRRVGLDRMHVGRRIARMVRARSWPFEPPTRTRRDEECAPREPLAPLAGRRSPTRAEPTDLAPLSLRIGVGLHTRLRAYCRVTGATVSETVAVALEGFLPARPGSSMESPLA